MSLSLSLSLFVEPLGARRIVMTADAPTLGCLIDNGDRRRDAVHVAVAPVTATERLSPGQHVGFSRSGDVEHVGPAETTIGVVDPFLREDVLPGERFWLFMYPNTVTSLRHVWTHPAFTPRPPVVSEAAPSEK